MDVLYSLVYCIIFLYMSGNPSKVAFAILGQQLDGGRGAARWQKWRPTVAICQHEDLLLDRLELIHDPKQQPLAERVVDDVRSVSPESEVRLHEISFRDPWDLEEVFAALHDFARGYTFRTEGEEYLIHITTGTHVQQICWFLLAESRHFPARLLQSSPPPRHQNGAGDYRIIDLDLSRYDRLATRFAEEQREGAVFLKSGIETRNPRFNTLIEQIERVAIAGTAPLLLTGPTGAGKSQLARRIYELKRRRAQLEGPLVEVNCATLRGDQAMSALFGHAKGAFTGATTARGGLLKSAEGGMLFLDEIGELGQDEQAMLLRAIEEKRFLPVGADKESESNFQLIAGTNRNLPAAVDDGRFREDLLARINLWTFALPGLKDRREDIAPNLDYELERYAAATGHKITMNRESRERFLRFAGSAEAAWSANFRDLNAAVTRMATLADGGRITVEAVDEELTRLRAAWRTLPHSGFVERFLSPEKAADLDLFDRTQLEAVLSVCRQARSLSDAGRQLFAVSRLNKQKPNDADRLRKYLARFGIQWSDVAHES